MTDRTKPEVDFPEGAAPTELASTDEILGDGEEAGRGDVVDVHYVGVSHSTGEQFDASWDRGEPLRFQLGVGQVISGWDKAVEGAHVGDRLLVVVPPKEGYGKEGTPDGSIKGNATLVFTVDILGAP